ncbi:MAG: ABC transporter permease [Anaerolineae bacterium]|nr:ABC transporter permease [Anaerolineae bacterium]
MLDANFFTALLSLSLVKATPLVLGAMSGILCERSGIINIGIEGMMLMSAFAGFLGAVFSDSLWVGVLVGVLTGAVMGAFLALLSIRYKVDQIIGGTVINLLAVGITSYFAVIIIDNQSLSGIGVLPIIQIPLLADIPVIGPILFRNQPITFMMLILVFVLHVALFYTPWGLRTRAVGEHPRAADTVGIRVNRMRYLDTTLGGMMAGLAGAFITLESVGSFESGVMTNGRGFIALAVMVSGNWRPINALIIAYIFGVSDALGVRLQLGDVNQLATLLIVAGLGMLIGGALWALTKYLGRRDENKVPVTQIALAVAGLVMVLAPAIVEIPETNIPFQFLGLPPYILTIIIVAGLVGNVRPPAAEGKVYEKQ